MPGPNQPYSAYGAPTPDTRRQRSRYAGVQDTSAGRREGRRPLPTRRHSQRGFVFWLLAVSLLAILGIAGLAVDVGRLQVIKGEAQSFTDFAALAAARELDGTPEGIERARRAVARNPMKWDFQSRSYEGTVIEFSADRKNWITRVQDPHPVGCVRVTANLERIGLFLIPALAGPRTGSVRASATAASEPAALFPAGSAGLLPFAVEAQHMGKQHFGIAPGALVQLDRYVQDPDSLHDAVAQDRVGREVSLGNPVRLSAVPPAAISAALNRRAAEDTNTRAQTYFEYDRSPGNGKRIGLVAVTNSKVEPVVVGFARVFLPVTQSPAGATAEWIGRPDVSAPGAAATVRLVE